MATWYMQRAKKEKNDEFYTLYEDVEKELVHYKEYFKDKIVYLPCDEPQISNFYKFFIDNFVEFGLKELVCTWLGGEEFFKVKKVHNELVNEYGYSFNSGDFNENNHFFDYCDIIVTNPPFSIWRNFFDVVIRSKKKFLIIGSFNNVIYKNVFPYMKDKSVHFGYNEVRHFYNNNPTNKEFGQISDVHVGVWFTNLPVRHYRPIVYGNKGIWQFYDDFEAIDVPKITYIPDDYDGLMGVPVTIFKYDIDDFNIIGASTEYSLGRVKLNGREPYKRIFIRRKKRKI